MQRKRQVYSSLSNQKPQPIQQVQQKPRSRNRKKRNKNPLNQHLRNAARVYLHEVKFVCKDEIFTILKNNNYFTKQSTQTSKKLHEDLENNCFKDSHFPTKFEEIQIGSHLNTKKHNRLVKQNVMYESYKSRYDIRQSSNTQPQRHRYLGTSQGNRQFSNLKPSDRQHKIVSDYFQKIKERKRRKSKKQQKNSENNINDTIKIYLQKKDSIGQKKKVRREANTSAAELYEQNRESHFRLVSEQSKTSAPSLNTIQSKQKLIVRNLRGFVINQKNQNLSDLLRIRGWKPFGQHSQKYTLKWTYNDSFKDYELVRNAYRSNRLMYFNHIKNNKLVNKADFLSLAKKLQQKGINISQFIPETYLISSQKQEFLQNFNIRVILSSLQKHINYFQMKNIKQDLSYGVYGVQKEFQNIADVKKFLISIQSETVQQELINENQCQNVLVNVPMVYNILVLSCYYLMLQEEEIDEKFLGKFSALCHDNSVLTALIIFNRADLPFEQYSRFRSTEKKRTSNKPPKTKEFSIVNGYLRAIKTFMTPSKKLIQAIFFCRQYLCIRLHQYLKGGLRNYWIMKPCAGSKGCGIEIIDRVQKVNQAFQSSSNKMVQKYIEDIWTVKQADIGDSHREMFEKVINKKFDIRQWVLINPPNSYIFSSFYVRICSKQYDFDTNDPCSHLSNFSINRENFQKYEDSVISEEEFEELMHILKRSAQFEKLKKQLKQRIRLLTDQAMLQCQYIPGTFEIVGFDILIDQEFNPWVIECNMSPACNVRTTWLKDMKDDMISGALQIVLDSSVYPTVQEEGNKKYTWENLSKVKISGDRDTRQSKQGVGISSPVNVGKGSGSIFKSHKRKNLSQLQGKTQNVI